MTAEPLQLLGLLVCCGAAAAALLSGDRRLRWAALALALVVAPVLVVGDVWDQPRVVDLRDEPAKLTAALALAAVAVAGGAAIFRRFGWAFPVAAFAALPLRLPVQFGGETSNLLIPLYIVIAAAFLAELWSSGAGDAAVRPSGAKAEPAAVTWLRRLLAATLVLYALQSAYSEDVSNAIENACFFLVPFAALFVLLVEVRWSERLLLWVLGALTAVALVFAGVAFWEYAARDLIFNTQLLESNQIHVYFRVNSLFHDPNVFGRYVALAIVALGAYLAWAQGGAWTWLGAAAAGVLLAALALSFSMTSFAALLAGLLVVAALRFGLRWAAAAVAVTAVGAALFLVLGGANRSDLGPDRGFDAEASGRVDLVEGGIELAADRPGWGWGSGSFGAAFAREIKRAETTTSHSEPITVAAEQGVVGFAVYLALLAVSLAMLFGGGAITPARAAVAASYVAMLVHSLGYAGFVIDPATWALLAIGAGLARAAAREPARAASPTARPVTA